MPFEIIENRADFERSKRPRIVLTDHGPEVPEEWDTEPEPEESYDAENFIEHQSELIHISPSGFTELAIMVPDKDNQCYSKFDFSGRRYLRRVYDTGHKKTLLKCGRQVEKSTMLGNKLLAYCCINVALNALYVSPTNQQTKVFSRDRLKEPMETSEFLKSWTTTKLSDNVFLKKFINRSQITLRYAYLNADRVRGIPADVISLDEIQDLLTDNIHVIEECASHSNLKIFMYSGTPKSMDNTIEHFWVEESTQNEWVVPCHRHAIKTGDTIVREHWNVLDEDNIGLTSIVCDKCYQPINPMDPESRWVSMNPEIAKELTNPFEGYHIPQIMVPWMTHDELLQKQKTYSRAKFHNEVLGLSYDSGSRPLTVQDIIDNCDPGFQLTDEFLQRLRQYIGGATQVYAGVDWSGGGMTEKSKTVITLGAYIKNKFTFFYFHRFEGREEEPQVQLEEIARLINLWNVHRIGCDYGGGFWPNDSLVRRFSFQRIVKYQYSNPNDKVRWEPGLKRFLVHRTEVMSDIFNAIKRRDVFRFPDYESFKNPYGQDFLNIFSEYSEQRRMNEYKKSPSVTDDSFHSAVLCFLVSMLSHPRPDVISPMTAGSSGKAES